jgi:tripartite-type tricarboxylate transporter receptor subunit TctC
MKRRLVVAFLALWTLALPARAETIRVVIPYAPGGALDPIARIVVNGWSKLRPADTIVVENIGGAGGIIGMSQVAKAAPDGRTLLFSPSGNVVVSPYMHVSLPYDATTAFDPVVEVGSVKSALIVRSSLDVHSLADLIAQAKGGAKLTFGSPGIGTSPHIAGELLNHYAGVALTHVPFRGLGPAFNNLLGGHIDMIATSVVGELPYIQANNARALVILDHERFEQLPDVPTVAEAGFPDLVMPQWYGLLAPAGLPDTLRSTYESELLSVMRAPEVKAQLAASGLANPQGARALRARMDADFKRWSETIPKLGIKPI